MKPRTIAPPEQHIRSKTVSRADLVYWLLQTGEDLDSLERVAQFAGFEHIPDQPPKLKPLFVDFTLPVETEPQTVRPEAISPRISAKWFRVVERKRLTGVDIDPSFTTTEPISIQGVGEFTPQELQPPTSEPQAALAPLIRWPRLWPFLKRASSVQFAGPIDVPRLADQIASGKLFYQFPRKR